MRGKTPLNLRQALSPMQKIIMMVKRDSPHKASGSSFEKRSSTGVVYGARTIGGHTGSWNAGGGCGGAVDGNAALC